jgi:hypothetical protein
MQLLGSQILKMQKNVGAEKSRHKTVVCEPRRSGAAQIYQKPLIKCID